MGFYALGFLILLIVGSISSHMRVNYIESGKTFKIGDSTYKCKTINTLKYGEE